MRCVEAAVVVGVVGVVGVGWVVADWVEGRAWGCGFGEVVLAACWFVGRVSGCVGLRCLLGRWVFWLRFWLWLCAGWLVSGSAS